MKICFRQFDETPNDDIGKDFTLAVVQSRLPSAPQHPEISYGIQNHYLPRMLTLTGQCKLYVVSSAETVKVFSPLPHLLKKECEV